MDRRSSLALEQKKHMPCRRCFAPVLQLPLLMLALPRPRLVLSLPRAPAPTRALQAPLLLVPPALPKLSFPATRARRRRKKTRGGDETRQPVLSVIVLRVAFWPPAALPPQDALLRAPKGSKHQLWV